MNAIQLRTSQWTVINLLWTKLFFTAVGGNEQPASGGNGNSDPEGDIKPGDKGIPDSTEEHK